MTAPSFCEPSLPYPCDLIPSFSDPIVLYRGQPTGIPNVAENGRTIRETAEFVSNLRPDGGLAGKVELVSYGPNMELGSRVGAIQQTRLIYQVRNVVGRASNAVIQFNFSEGFSRQPLYYRILPDPFTVAAINNSSVGNCSGMQSPVGTVECSFAWIDTQASFEVPFVVEYSSARLRPSFTFRVFADQIDVNPSNNDLVYEIGLPYPL